MPGNLMAQLQNRQLQRKASGANEGIDSGNSSATEGSGTTFGMPPPPSPLGGPIYRPTDSRKDVALIANKRMKQLQWDKVSKAMLAKTVWGTQLLPEEELVEKMRKVDVWAEIDDAFTAKEAVISALSE